MWSLHSATFTAVLSSACVLFLSYSIHELSHLTGQFHTLNQQLSSILKDTGGGTKTTSIAWVEGDGEQSLSTYLRHVVEVLRLLGYKVVTGLEPEEWDVLWTHEYSISRNRYVETIRNAKSHQYVNHIPGSGYYTSKVSLITSLSSDDTLKAFQLPKEKETLLKFAKSRPDIMWIQKDNTHRNIRVLSIERMNLDRMDSFVQQFMDKPFLIDNRKFDIGIYTVVTSLHPLRVYIYEGDALIRFCSEDYNPFDIDRLDKYVVGNDYTPIWKIPSLKKFFINQQLGWKGALNEYLRNQKKNPQKIWNQIDGIISEVFQKQQVKMLHALKSNPSKAKYFELSRFDFVIDVDLNVFLMEANLSPNLSSEHFAQNQILYQEVLLNVFSLVGIASSFSAEASRYQLQNDRCTDISLISDHNIYVPLAECSEICSTCEIKIECQLCATCMPHTTLTMLREVFMELVNRRSMKLLSTNYTKQKPLTKKDLILRMWREEKCKGDSSHITCYNT